MYSFNVDRQLHWKYNVCPRSKSITFSLCSDKTKWIEIASKLAAVLENQGDSIKVGLFNLKCMHAHINDQQVFSRFGQQICREGKLYILETVLPNFVCL